jgi:hypothetical protein
MTTQAGVLSSVPRWRSARWSAERRFYFGMSLALAAAVFLGFARTFFLRNWYPDWAQAHGAPETFFLVHGVFFVGWFLLLLVQPSLVAAGRLDLHRRLGRFGGALAVAMVVLGVVGALMAARRATGFVNVTAPSLVFLVVPLAVIALFALFVTLALVYRRNPQHHKRYMLLASIALIEAGVGRWPFGFMRSPSPVPGLGMIEFCVDLFLVPMVIWDLAFRRRLHPVTLWGGLALIAMQLLRFPLAGTSAWMAFASWAVGLLPG